ncbi:hypothetical protein Hanom_Chr09g00849331 [Helianthus anomalus]
MNLVYIYIMYANVNNVCGGCRWYKIMDQHDGRIVIEDRVIETWIVRSRWSCNLY